MRKKLNIFFIAVAFIPVVSCETTGEAGGVSDQNKTEEEGNVNSGKTSEPEVKPEEVSEEVENRGQVNLDPGMRAIREVSATELSGLFGFDLVDLGSKYNGMITVGESGLIDGPISVKSTHPQTRSFCHYDGEFINGKKSGIWEVNRKMGDIDTRFTLQITYEKDVCQRSALKGVFDLESKEYFEYYMEGSSSCDVDGIGMVARKRYLDGAESQTESMFDSEKAP